MPLPCKPHCHCLAGRPAARAGIGLQGIACNIDKHAECVPGGKVRLAGWLAAYASVK